MKNEALGRLACFSMALAVILGGSSLYYGHRAGRLAAHAELQSQRALSALTEDLCGLDAALRKTAWASDGAMGGVLAAEIWSRAEGAKTALSLLPLSEARLEQYQRFLAQTSGYAYSLLRSGLYGGSGEDPAERLAALSGVCAELEGQLGALKERADAGDAVFTAVTRGQGRSETVAAAFARTEEAFPAYDPLTYDGPYSAHLEQRTARGLAGRNGLGPEQARAAAAALLGLDAGDLTLLYESAGTIPAYGFSDGAGLTVRVAQSGGALVALSDERPPREAALTAEQALEAGRVFLEEHGFAGMAAEHYTLSGGALSAKYYATQDDAVLYPDLVTLSVSLHDGTVLRLDASEYWMNHVPRQAPGPDESAPPAGLTVLRARTALLPTAGLGERWCTEYLCETPQGRALCYVGRDSGQMEELFLLSETDSGTLVR